MRATALLATATCGLGVLYLWHGLAPRAPGGEQAATRWFGNLHALAARPLGLFVLGWLAAEPGCAPGPRGSPQVALMIGAVTTTLIYFGPSMVALPAVVLVAVAVIAYARRRSTVELAAFLRRLTARN